MAIMKTPIGNSPFLGEMFAPLLHGCYFAMARPDGHQDIAYLGSLIATHGVTHIAMTSAVLRAFLEWPDAAQCRSLRAVQCGGDVVSDELRARFLAFFPDARFVVTYGTTESGHALSGECPASDGWMARASDAPYNARSCNCLTANWISSRRARSAKCIWAGRDWPAAI